MIIDKDDSALSWLRSAQITYILIFFLHVFVDCCAYVYIRTRSAGPTSWRAAGLLSDWLTEWLPRASSHEPPCVGAHAVSSERRGCRRYDWPGPGASRRGGAPRSNETPRTAEGPFAIHSVGIRSRDVAPCASRGSRLASRSRISLVFFFFHPPEEQILRTVRHQVPLVSVSLGDPEARWETGRRGEKLSVSLIREYLFPERLGSLESIHVCNTGSIKGTLIPESWGTAVGLYTSERVFISWEYYRAREQFPDPASNWIVILALLVCWNVAISESVVL